MAHLPLSHMSCGFAVDSLLLEGSVDGLSLLDSPPDFFSALESWTSSPVAIPEKKKSPSKMQNQNQQLPISDTWSWSIQQPRDLIYSNLISEPTNIDTPYSPFQDRDTWSSTSSPTPSSSPIPKPTTPKDINAPPFSFRGSSTSSPSLHKQKATKGERLEKRREKNRTSQRRYRERKEKYIQDLENQCKKLRERNEALCARLKLDDQVFTHENVPAVRDDKAEWQWPELSLDLDLDDADGEVEFN